MLERFQALMEVVSDWSVPALILLIPLAGVLRKVPVYEAFTRGARQGLATGLRVIPFMVAMFCSVEVFRASGAMDAVLAVAAPVTRLLGIPQEVVPLGMLRPLSGSASLGMLAYLVQQYGPDSLVGKIASAMQGSTETTFYVIAVYFGAVGITRIRYVLVVGVMADIAGFLAAVAFTRLLLG